MLNKIVKLEKRFTLYNSLKIFKGYVTALDLAKKGRTAVNI
jgi:hypothetical protein